MLGPSIFGSRILASALSASGVSSTVRRRLDASRLPGGQARVAGRETGRGTGSGVSSRPRKKLRGEDDRRSSSVLSRLDEAASVPTNSSSSRLKPVAETDRTEMLASGGDLLSRITEPAQSLGKREWQVFARFLTQIDWSYRLAVQQ